MKYALISTIKNFGISLSYYRDFGEAEKMALAREGNFSFIFFGKLFTVSYAQASFLLFIQIILLLKFIYLLLYANRNMLSYTENAQVSDI